MLVRNKGIVGFITLVIIAFGLWETLYGWSQLLGLSRSLHPNYPATGTFYNPGPFCGYIAMLMPLALYSVVKNNCNPLKWLSYIYLILSLSLMPALMGRTGWIAAIAGCIFVLFACKRIQWPKGKKLWLVLLAVIILGGGLFYIKPQSALGRLFIWQNGVLAMLEHPLLGVGWDNVAGALGSAQESYFSAHENSLFAIVAGSPEYAFNDFLQIGIAYGFVGLISFVSVLCFSIICACKAEHYGLAGSIVAFCVVCMSSYPFQFTAFIITVALMVVTAICSCPGFSVFVRVPLSILISVFALLSCQTIDYRKSKLEEWDRVKYRYQYRLSDRDCLLLDSLMTDLSWSHRFLFDYGKALRQSKLYEKSNGVLLNGTKQSSDPMFLNLIGRNFHDTKDYEQAELYFIRSICRLPGRMYPYYLLAKLYADSANFDYEKFGAAYSKAMSLVPKVNSTAINQMKSELQQINDSISVAK